ncbi:MAG: hypothetical protein JO328_02300 [Hyphomicrobiales bacterium]|nr:hypothetical protein [Hyphomicrobiales bacterium]MBV8826059.1 hypothetical protein [Hyphomicrobiales bacterium]MBV9429894.1 hypothetical protein [Bradyrhizobiaceae bacterium]
MSEPVFSPRLLIGWIGAAVATFALSLYFMGRPGEPGGTDSVGPSTYSRSAIGYAGVADVLQHLGVPIAKSRDNSADKLGKDGVLVLAEPRPTATSEPALRALLDARAVLLVLPKWTGRASEKNPGWLATAEERPTSQAQWVLNLVAGGGEVVRETQPPVWNVNLLAGHQPQLEKPVQLIRSSALRPIVGSPAGILVGELNQRRTVWVLADPDVIANHGIARGDNAALALAIINRLRGRKGPVVFDETIHGFVAQPANPLALLFEFPFVVATLQVVAALALLLWATVARFGAPQSAPPPLSAGRQGLLQNVAQLITFAGHGQVMVRRYVQETVRETARQLHAPRGLSGQGLAAWLTRVGQARGVTVDCAAVIGEVEQLPDRRRGDLAPLVRIARDIHRWRREIVDGRSRHSRGH